METATAVSEIRMSHKCENGRVSVKKRVDSG